MAETHIWITQAPPDDLYAPPAYRLTVGDAAQAAAIYSAVNSEQVLCSALESQAGSAVYFDPALPLSMCLVTVDAHRNAAATECKQLARDRKPPTLPTETEQPLVGLFRLAGRRLSSRFGESVADQWVTIHIAPFGDESYGLIGARVTLKDDGEQIAASHTSGATVQQVADWIQAHHMSRLGVRASMNVSTE